MSERLRLIPLEELKEIEFTCECGVSVVLPMAPAGGTPIGMGVRCPGCNNVLTEIVAALTKFREARANIESFLKQTAQGSHRRFAFRVAGEQ